MRLFAMAAVAASIAAIISRGDWLHGRRGFCGWSLPGISPLWSAQSSSLYLAEDGGAAIWPTQALGDAEPLLRMPFLADALTEVDAQATSLPVLWPNMQDLALRLRVNMVPHIIRGLLPSLAEGRPFGPDAALAALSDVQGAAKKTHNASNDGLIAQYFGPEREMPLHEFLSGESAGYWVACIETRGFGARAAGAEQWLGTMARALERHALLGLTRSSASELCVRVSRGRSRVQIHSDAWHGTLGQLGTGPRAVLLWMPDTVGLLGAYMYAPDGPGGTIVPLSDHDPRRVNASDAPPGLRRAPTLVATLQPGDVLHIPVAWFHVRRRESNTASVDPQARPWPLTDRAFASRLDCCTVRGERLDRRRARNLRRGECADQDRGRDTVEPADARGAGGFCGSALRTAITSMRAERLFAWHEDTVR